MSFGSLVIILERRACRENKYKDVGVSAEDLDLKHANF